MVQNRNLMEPTVDNIPEFRLCDFFLGLNAKSVVQLNRRKTFRTENRIICTCGSFEKRSPKRVVLIINI